MTPVPHFVIVAISVAGATWILYSLSRIKHQLTGLKGMIMKIADVLEQVDKTTDETANRVAALINSIKQTNGELTPAQEAEVGTIIGHLQNIGKDQNEPVPPLPPAPPTPTP